MTFLFLQVSRVVKHLELVLKTDCQHKIQTVEDQANVFGRGMMSIEHPLQRWLTDDGCYEPRDARCTLRERHARGTSPDLERQTEIVTRCDEHRKPNSPKPPAANARNFQNVSESTRQPLPRIQDNQRVELQTLQGCRDWREPHFAAESARKL